MQGLAFRKRCIPVEETVPPGIEPAFKDGEK